MHRAYFSSVLQASADSAWHVVRDFNDYPRDIDGVTARRRNRLRGYSANHPDRRRQRAGPLL
jgi:hypothetical protein